MLKKNEIKFAAQRAVSLVSKQNHPPIICASMGRSGSTVLTLSIEKALRKSCFNSELPVFSRLGLFQTDLVGTTLPRNFVYKTHDFPRFIKDTKFIFIFGLASDSVKSVLQMGQTYGDKWLNAHLKHLHANGPIENIIGEDVLRLEEQVARWTTFTESSVLCLRYDAIWDQKDLVSEFVGMQVELPSKMPRSEKKIAPILSDKIKENYARLDAHIKSLPDAFLT
jgi:hypothetical protein